MESSDRYAGMLEILRHDQVSLGEAIVCLHREYDATVLALKFLVRMRLTGPRP